MPPAKTITVRLGDQKRELRYEKRHVYRLERTTGRTVFEQFEDLKRGSFSAMVDLICAGLWHEQPDLKPEEVADMVDFDQLKDVMVGVAEGLGAVIGAKVGEKAEGNGGEGADS